MCFLLAGLAACGGPDAALTPEEFNTLPVRLPNGAIIRAEQLVETEQIRRGMRYRDDLPANRGLLFIHGQPGFYSYWMYQVKVPLDIVWLDRQKRVVEVVHNAAPCPGPPEECRSYGGQFEASYVLELRAGVARASGLQPGAQVEF